MCRTLIEQSGPAHAALDSKVGLSPNSKVLHKQDSQEVPLDLAWVLGLKLTLLSTQPGRVLIYRWGYWLGMNVLRSTFSVLRSALLPYQLNLVDSSYTADCSAFSFIYS